MLICVKHYYGGMLPAALYHRVHGPVSDAKNTVYVDCRTRKWWKYWLVV